MTPARCLWFAALALLLGGCGASCPTLAAERGRYLARPASPPDDGPDLAVDVPFALLDALLAAEVAALPPVPVPVPGTKRLTLTARGVRARPAPDGRLGFTLDFDVRDGGRVLFGLAADAEVAPQIDPRTGHLQLALGPESLRAIAPRLGPEAGDALAEAVRRQLPPLARAAVTRDQLRALTDRALSALTTGGYALLRDHVLVRFVAATQVDLGLPPLPLARLDVRARPGWLELGMHADLPTTGGLADAGAPPGRRVRVRLTGSAVAELANAAIGRGELPGRYTEEGRPDPQGPLLAALAWAPGERPLKALLWQTAGTCMTARVGGTPSLSAAGRQVTVRLADGRVEDVQGSLLVEAGAWMKGLWDRTFTVTRTVAAETSLTLGARRLTLAVATAQADEAGVTLGLDVRGGPAKAR